MARYNTRVKQSPRNEYDQYIPDKTAGVIEFIISLSSLFTTVEEYIYISNQKYNYDDANQLCQDEGYLHLPIMDTEKRQHIFNIARVFEFPKWVLSVNKQCNFVT